MARGGAAAAPVALPAPARGVSLASPGLDRAWLERLPQLVEECCEEWSLEPEEPFPDGNVSHVVPAGNVVLKIQWPHRESEHEAAALELWDGEGAVRLLAQDAARHALLLERCRPGKYLGSRDPDEVLDVLIESLPRLWKPAGAPFRTLSEEAEWWVGYLPSRQIEPQLLGAAIDALEELAPTQGEQVLLHQDLHGENVLSAEREPWLAIDPKPLVGEREFGLASIIRSSELGHSERAVQHRLDRLTSELGLDRERARKWALGQTIAWTSESEHGSRHVETARWLLQAG